MRAKGISWPSIERMFRSGTELYFALRVELVRNDGDGVEFRVTPAQRYRWRRSTMSRGRGHYTRHPCYHGLYEVCRWLLDAGAHEVWVGRHQIRNMDELANCRLWRRKVQSEGHHYQFSSLCCCEFVPPRGNLTGNAGEE